MIRKKSFSSIFLCSMLLLTGSGCGSTEKDSIDPVSYTTAYLDLLIQGKSPTSDESSHLPVDTLQTSHDAIIEEFVSSYLGPQEDAPGSLSLSQQLRDNYTAFWETVFSQTKYKVTSAQKEEDSYQIHIDTHQMELSSAMEPIYQEKLNAYSETLLAEDLQDQEQIYTLLLDAYTEAFAQVVYQDPVSVTISLEKDSSDHWCISDEEVDALKVALLDETTSITPFSLSEQEVLSEQDILPELTTQTIDDSYSEAAPNLVYPEDLDTTPAYALGETISLQKDGVDLAAFSIDQVSFSSERSEYDLSNPEQVVVITYTYQNLGSADPLLFDQASFQVLEKDTVCQPYYLENLIAPDIALLNGESMTASLAYGVSASCSELTIYINSPQLTSPVQVTVSLS